MRQGIYIVVEGIDGCGKTTFISKLISALKGLGISSEMVREPGGTKTGAKIREIVQNAKMPPLAQLFLFCADRTILIDDVRKKLKKGTSIVSDRSYLSSIAYQGAGGGEKEALVRHLCEIAVGTTIPDLVVLLDLDVSTALDRCGVRGDKKTVFEKEGGGFMDRVRKKFLDMAAAEPDRWIVVSAKSSPDEVFNKAWKKIHKRLKVWEGVKK